MLVEARILRRAAKAYLRNSGTLPRLAKAMHVSDGRAQRFLDGDYHWVTPTVTKRILALLDPRSRAYVEENLRTIPGCDGKIPSVVIAPVIEEAIEQAGGLTALAFDTGMHERRILAVRYAMESAVGSSVADKIISRSLGPARWGEDDLRRWYYGNAVLSTTNPTRRRAAARRDASPAARSRSAS